MPVKIVFPVAGEVVTANTVPHIVTVRAIADSNINTDVRFKLNGTIVGIDTSATTINVTGSPQYQYQFNVSIPAAGIHSIEAEDINQATVPTTVRSTDSISFELKLNLPTITLAKTATTLATNLITATITNRPTGSSVRFTLNGKNIKEDSTAPFNVSVTESGELKAELIVGGNVIQTAILNVVVATPIPTPTPTPFKGDKGDKGEKGDTGQAGIPGLQGVKGDAGIPGPAGERGAVGEKGAVGDRGMQGIPGTPGNQITKIDWGIWQNISLLFGSGYLRVRKSTNLSNLMQLQGVVNATRLDKFAKNLGKIPNGYAPFAEKRFAAYQTTIGNSDLFLAGILYSDSLDISLAFDRGTPVGSDVNIHIDHLFIEG